MNSSVMEHYQGQTILMVDDTPANLSVLAHVLEAQGFDVAVAQDGEEGLLRARFVKPDLVLLDVMMPRMDGLETCLRLKSMEELKDVPVIFMTALAESSDKLAGFEVGGVDYITKPFRIEEVLARVKTHLALRAMQKQLAEQNQLLRQEVALRQQFEAYLQDAHFQLEDRVAQRTIELADANAQLKEEIGERKQAEEWIRYLANHDALTALPNRVLFQDRVKHAIAHAHRTHTSMAVLFIDLDYFKHINDSLGHQVGDQLLEMVASRLRGCVREDDTVARLGGDEFVLSLPLHKGSGDAGLVAQKVLDALDQPFLVEEHQLHVSASIGISLYPGDGDDVESLMRTADTAMYYAKEKGRGNYQFFTPALNKAAQQRLSLTNSLRQALTRGEFALHYQPQVDLENGTIFSAEALLRWRPEGKAPVSPIEFITIAEETGLILPIGEWVLREACRQLKRWHSMGHTDLVMAVNLSPRQFYQPNFQNMIKDILLDAELPPASLDLEITEGILMQRSEDNVDTLRFLSGMGIKLSIDDFGTGYSSLAYLQRFPVDALKIDRSFVRGIGQDSNATALLVTAIISMAQSLRLKVLAEGVETPEQINFLRAHGCLSAQGYYYSEPVPADTFTEMLHKQDDRSLKI